MRDLGPPEENPVQDSAGQERIARMEFQLRVLEGALLRNAIDLKGRVVEQLDRIADSIAAGEAAHGKRTRRKHARSGITEHPDAGGKDTLPNMGELRESLRASREEMERLADSIAEMKSQLSA